MHFTTALAKHFHDRALVLVLDVDGEALERLANLAVDRPEDDLGAGYRQLVTLAPHILHQDRQVQLAPAGDLEFVRIVGRLDPQRDVVDQLLRQTFAQVTARHILPLAASKGRIIDLECHRYCRLVDDQRGQRLDRLGIAYRLGDLKPVDAGKGDNFAGHRLVEFDLLQPQKAQDLQHPSGSVSAIGADHGDVRIAGNSSALHTAYANHADIARIIERADLQLKWPIGIDNGRRHIIDYGLEQDIHFRRPLR